MITEELRNRIDGGRLLEVPDAGHAVQMAKDVLVEALLGLAHDADRTWEERDSLARGEPDREQRALR